MEINNLLLVAWFCGGFATANAVRNGEKAAAVMSGLSLVCVNIVYIFG